MGQEMTNKPKQSRGITLIELMVTIAIAAGLIASAVPNFEETIRNNRMVTQINELHASLNFARSEAIKRNSNITICRSSNGSSCTDDWKNGWIVFVDSNFNGSVDGEDVLRVHGAIFETNTLTFSQTRVIYRRNGLPRENSDGTFTLCDERGAEKARGLIISRLSGLAYLATDSDSNEILNDGDDLDLACSS